MKLSNLATFLIAAVCIFAIGKLVLKPTGTETTSIHPNAVVLYATDWCGYCKKTREFFKDNNIAYVEFDIEKSAEGKQEYNQLKGKGIPLVVINGKVIRGYNPSSMKEILQL
ncbi:MAG: glutaredoxin family protein [Cellvibrio sp.]|nr:glutaredoxin family protein [Cellvibrio sp.]